jgi:hypothetical protein
MSHRAKAKRRGRLEQRMSSWKKEEAKFDS